MQKIGIVVVCYNGVADTRECLESVRQLTYPEFFTVVVDNASRDNTAEAVRAEFPEVTLIVNPQNTGFTGGNQIGVRAALQQGAEFIFLLNPDTTVAPDLLERLLEAWEAAANPGAIGPLMLLYDEPEIVWSAGGQIDRQGRVAHLHQGEEAPPPRESLLTCDFVSGCGLLFSRSVYEHVGFFDERFFLYFEESDLCTRVRKAGYEVGTVLSARLWHKVSRATGADSPLTLYYMRRNQLLYLKKHGTRAGLSAALLDSLRLLLVWIIKRNPKARTLKRALLDFRAGRFGRADGI